jgi:hypothetical protein
MSKIHILWDDSSIWGVLMLRAALAWELPFRLVRGADIASGVLERDRPAALLVPGGAARSKQAALGASGVAALRGYVSGGGLYLGVCGGAGLGLSDGGLDLCPWCRRPFKNRMQHFLSGHMHVQPARGHELVPDELPDEPLLPVWWPARFAYEPLDSIDVLATYAEPGHDVWVADLSLRKLPAAALDEWEETYGVELRPRFLRGAPAVITGTFGAGRYVLSYAHLETPASPAANAWLAHILRLALNDGRTRDRLPAWILGDETPRWDDPFLTETARSLAAVIATGLDHHLLFWRNPWLLGWRRGIPGLALNSLYVLALQAAARTPTPEARTYWANEGPAFMELFRSFKKELSGYLLAERLAMTLANAPGAPEISGLKERRTRLFGPPSWSGGPAGELVHHLEELVRLQHSRS